MMMFYFLNRSSLVVILKSTHIMRVLLLLLLISACQSQSTEKKYLENIRFEVIDDNFYQLIDPEAKVEILAEGHEWTEGPLWVESEQMLLYSDIPNNAIYSWKEGEGSQLWLETAGGLEGRPGSNGLLLNNQNELILCQHGARQMAKMNTPLNTPAADFTSLADRYNNLKLNSPNDAVYASNGDLYFTDPPYGINQETEKELDHNGVYRFTKDGDLNLLSTDFTRPNGIGLSPDEKQLIVANSDPKSAKWMIFDLSEDGSLSNERLLFDATDWVGNDMPGLPDGLKVTKSGHLFATGPGGLYLFSPDYALLGILHTGKHTSNCALNTDESYLYLTADDLLIRVPLLKERNS
jgi:gluconolactonase